MSWELAYNAYTGEAPFPLIRMAVNSARGYERHFGRFDDTIVRALRRETGR